MDEEEEEAERVRLYEARMVEAVQTAKEAGVLPTHHERARVTLRLYTHRQSVFRAHSFLVGNEQGGLSEKLGRIPIQTNKTTLIQLRQLIETTIDNNMVRRNPIYQDFLITVFTLPNPYKYSDKERRHYRFGFYERPDDPYPTLIPEAEENDLLVVNAMSNFITDDLIIVARSQLRPDGRFPDPEDAAIGR